MPILVTGATGNVGAEVLRRLVDGGEDVIAARRPVDTAPRAVDFDFLDPATFDRAFAGITTLFLVRPPAISNVRRDLVPALEVRRSTGAVILTVFGGIFVGVGLLVPTLVLFG
jgi:uncharacterized protein YbjT (DUF2867 family)